MVFTAHLRQGRCFTIDLSAPLRLTKALLVSYRGDNSIYVLMKQGIEDAGTVITILSKDSRHDKLHLQFHEGEEVSFFIIGNGTVHLNGYFCCDSEIDNPGKVYTISDKIKKTSEGGVSIEELQIGIGAEARKGSSVDIAYNGIRLHDHSIIDKRNATRPLQFRIKKGMFDEIIETGLLGIKAGGRRRLTFIADWKFHARHPRVPIGAKICYEIHCLAVS